MNAQALLDLAERCEREEPSWDLDVVIGRWFGQHDYAWWRDRAGPSDFTRSIDAAVTLVPEGLNRSVRTVAPYRPRASVWSCDMSVEENASGNTEALALCAAALKARAAMLTEKAAA